MSKHPTIASDVESYRREWGIPNWEDEKSYGKVSTWNRKRWYWEFQRRRPSIRKYFDRRADAEYQQLLSLYQISPESFVDNEPPPKPHEAGFGIEVAEEDRRLGVAGDVPLANVREIGRRAVVVRNARDWHRDVVLAGGQHDLLVHPRAEALRAFVLDLPLFYGVAYILRYSLAVFFRRFCKKYTELLAAEPEKKIPWALQSVF